MIAPAPASNVTSPWLPALIVPAMIPFPVRLMSLSALSVSDTTFEAVIRPPAVTVIGPLPARTFASVIPSVSVTSIAPLRFVASSVATIVFNVIASRACAVNLSPVIITRWADP